MALDQDQQGGGGGGGSGVPVGGISAAGAAVAPPPANAAVVPYRVDYGGVILLPVSAPVGLSILPPPLLQGGISAAAYFALGLPVPVPVRNGQ